MNEITGEIIGNLGEDVIDWMCKLSDKTFMSDVVFKDWGSEMIMPL